MGLGFTRKDKDKEKHKPPKQDKIEVTYSLDLKNRKIEKTTKYETRAQTQTREAQALIVQQQVVEKRADGPTTTATSTWFGQSWYGEQESKPESQDAGNTSVVTNTAYLTSIGTALLAGAGTVGFLLGRQSNSEKK